MLLMQMVNKQHELSAYLKKGKLFRYALVGVDRLLTLLAF